MKDQVLVALKGALKAKGISYRKLASMLSLSEPSVKRVFSKGALSLERFLEICDVAEISPESLFGAVSGSVAREYEYSANQEEFLASNPRHLAFFDLLRKGHSAKQVARSHGLSDRQLQKFLKDLERLELIEWLPGDRAKLLTGKNVRWRKAGALRRKLLPRAKDEFLSGPFDEANGRDCFVLVELSQKSQKKLKARIEELMDDVYRESSIDELAKSKTETVGFFWAYRPWNFSLLTSLREKKRVGEF